MDFRPAVDGGLQEGCELNSHTPVPKGSVDQSLSIHIMKRTAPTGDGRNFASFANIFEVFAKFFEVFASFSQFLDVLGPVWTRSDTFGCIRMRLGAFGCVRALLENFGFFRKKWSKHFGFCIFGKVFESNLLSSSDVLLT